MIELKDVNLPLDAGLEDGAEIVRDVVAGRLGVKASEVRSFKIVKRSVDARRKSNVHFVATILVDTGDETPSGRQAGISDDEPVSHIPSSEPRPLVVGFGPAGMFAALTLARAGAHPLVVERGSSLGQRIEKVAQFNGSGVLDPECNVQFGEGGAGTFSDGKLNTNIHNPLVSRVISEFVAAGAPEEISWQARPHVGTDRLGAVVGSIRREVERLGGEVLFDTRLADIVVERGRVLRAVLERGASSWEVPVTRMVLAIGHSARDTFSLLYCRGLPMERKPFSLGVRVEHLQRDIDIAQYGRFAGHPALGAADYRLSCHLPDGRGVYTFCMCPGGTVVAAASEEGMVVTNGMSTFARDGSNANSALLVGVTPEDMGGEGPLAGVEFQRRWERAAFEAGGGAFCAPAQLMGDFLDEKPRAGSAGRGGAHGASRVEPTYPRGITWTSLESCLPGFVSASLRRAVPIFSRRLKGFDSPDAVLTGVESRSSSPVRIIRDAGTFQSQVAGIYPCGEGAGYAGGIMSSAIDGIRVARALLVSDGPRFN